MSAGRRNSTAPPLRFQMPPDERLGLVVGFVNQFLLAARQPVAGAAHRDQFVRDLVADSGLAQRTPTELRAAAQLCKALGRRPGQVLPRTQQEDFTFRRLGSHGVCSVVSVAAGEGLKEADIPDDLIFSMTDTEGADTYPICGAVWAVMFVKQPNDKAGALKLFLSST